MVDGGREGGRRLKCARPHQTFLFTKEKYEFVYSQLSIWGLLALEDDRLTMAIFLGEGGG